MSRYRAVQLAFSGQDGWLVRRNECLRCEPVGELSLGIYRLSSNEFDGICSLSDR
jgi:hypothetical protein